MTTSVLPTHEPQLVGPPEDIEAIRRTHRDWWAANHHLEIPRCQRNFAPDTLMFNLNGHTYYGLAEMTKVWEYYVGVLEIDHVLLWDYRIFVHGDLAYITCEGVFPTKATTDDAWSASNLQIGDKDGPLVGIRFRETSVARRDDGAGNPVWKIWHFHCSPTAPDDEVRPGFDDTWLSRGGDNGGAVVQTAELPLP
jgi:ketosteroid isomerase-like protein